MRASGSLVSRPLCTENESFPTDVRGLELDHLENKITSSVTRVNMIASLHLQRETGFIG